MTANGLTVDMLPARHGDGLWVEWGPADDRHRMVVDGGTKPAFAHMRDRLEALDGADRHIDLLVVTHIDLDHIEAPIELLRAPVAGLTFGDVWFNDYRHLPGTGGPAPPGTERGGVQGEFLAALLGHRGLPWNSRFGGGPVVVPDDGELPRIDLPGGVALVLLSPTPAKLEPLAREWAKAVAQADLSPGDRARVLQLLEERMGPVAPDRGGPKTPGQDGSEANGSSIAFLAEYGTERWLFAADAHVDVVVHGLRRYGATRDEPLPLTGLKVPHHGSIGNVSVELLQLIDCNRFLISTNGAYFGHPDEQCVDLLVEHSGPTELIFNYRTEHTERWLGRDGVTSTFLYDTEHVPVDRSMADSRPVIPGGTEPAQAVAPELPPGLAAEPPTTIGVSVYHGSLDRANSPVIVGHYAARPLSGAEGYIDFRYEGRLRDRHRRDQYPDAVGEHVYVMAPEHGSPSQGSLVVGLGEYGELTALQLAETVRAALVTFALDRADAARPAPRHRVELEISSVLVGATGDQGMGVRASARAIITGVVEANQALRDSGGGSTRSQYTQLDFFERSAPDAELAMLALGGQGDDEEEGADRYEPDALPADVVVDRNLHRTDGRLEHSIPVDGEQRPWRQVRVCAEDPDDRGNPLLALTYQIDGGFAGIGSGRHVIERDRLMRILSTAGNQVRPPAALYTTLFELLLPQELKWDLRTASDLQIEVDEVTADIPWEMLEARNPRRGTREALALRAPFTRRLQVPAMGRIERADEPRALVVGNPPAGPHWPPLPGAYEEAVAVTAALDAAQQIVVPLLFEPGRPAGEDATEKIESALCQDPFRIIHVAGHGSFDPDDPTRTGVVIGENAYLTALFIGQLQVVPDLVFLNCCHLGRIEGRSGERNRASGVFHKLGASMAQQLIRSGVRAVVAAGWAVDDRAATAFATTFYGQMIRAGAPFGDAVYLARQAADDVAPDSSTWGAYQCYGDSGFRLGVSRPAAPPHRPVTVRETLRRLEYLVDRVENMTPGAVLRDEWLTQEITTLSATVRDSGWLDLPDGGRLAEQVGRAHAELRDFETAIQWYDEALGHPNGSASLGAIEQRANLLDRHASLLSRRATELSEAVGDPTRASRAAEAFDTGDRTGGAVTGPASADAAREAAGAAELASALAEKAQADIALLGSLGPTSERGALTAGRYKRLAVIQSGAARRAALKAASEGYLAAYEREVEAKGADAAAYALLNHVQLETIRSLGGDAAATGVAAEHVAEVKRVTNRLARLPAAQQSYWDAAGKADARLTTALMAPGGVLRGRKQIVTAYVAALRRRATVRERSSTLDHLDDLSRLHPDDDIGSVLREILRSIDEQLVKGDRRG